MLKFIKRLKREALKREVFSFVRDKKYSEALKLLEKALKKYPNDTELVSEEISVYSEASQYDKAKERCYNILKSNPFDLYYLHVLWLLADVLRKEKKYEEAIKTAEKILTKEPKSTAGRFMLSNIYSDMGDFKQAIEKKEEFIELIKNKADTYSMSETLLCAYADHAQLCFSGGFLDKSLDTIKQFNEQFNKRIKPSSRDKKWDSLYEIDREKIIFNRKSEISALEKKINEKKIKESIGK